MTNLRDEIDDILSVVEAGHWAPPANNLDTMALHGLDPLSFATPDARYRGIIEEKNFLARKLIAVYGKKLEMARSDGLLDAAKEHRPAILEAICNLHGSLQHNLLHTSSEDFQHTVLGTACLWQTVGLILDETMDGSELHPQDDKEAEPIDPLKAQVEISAYLEATLARQEGNLAALMASIEGKEETSIHSFFDHPRHKFARPALANWKLPLIQAFVFYAILRCLEGIAISSLCQEL